MYGLLNQNLETTEVVTEPVCYCVRSKFRPLQEMSAVAVRNKIIVALKLLPHRSVF